MLRIATCSQRTCCYEQSHDNLTWPDQRNHWIIGTERYTRSTTTEVPTATHHVTTEHINATKYHINDMLEKDSTSVSHKSSQLASLTQLTSPQAEFEPRLWAQMPSWVGITSLSPDPRLKLGLYDTTSISHELSQLESDLTHKSTSWVQAQTLGSNTKLSWTHKSWTCRLILTCRSNSQVQVLTLDSNSAYMTH